LRILAGNHEEMFLDSFDSDEVLRHFLRHGGRETLLSYGLDPHDYARMTLEELREAMPVLIPAADIAFVRAMEDQVRIGDYLFVHAGIRPGVALEAQATSDLRWIRGEFLGSSTRAISPWSMATRSPPRPRSCPCGSASIPGPMPRGG
jgi:serine/threonine protein phosphatase 1